VKILDGLKISFEKGGTVYAKFHKKNSSAIEYLKKILPFDTEIFHTRWCGREIFMPIKTGNNDIGSDLTRNVSKFDLVYWMKEKGDIHDETISLFYGAESLQFYGGPLYVEVISVDQEELLDEIGERVWLMGKERVKIEKITD
jgi:hypothetical protein